MEKLSSIRYQMQAQKRTNVRPIIYWYANGMVLWHKRRGGSERRAAGVSRSGEDERLGVVVRGDDRQSGPAGPRAALSAAATGAARGDRRQPADGRRGVAARARPRRRV